MDEMKKMSIEAFVEVLESKAPVPGGGGASALVGALAMSLGDMVGSLTVGKKKYADVEDEIKAVMDKGHKLTRELLSLMDEDAKAFEPLSKAYSLPKETDEEKAYKDKVMEDALLAATKVPLLIMERCCDAIDLIETFAAKGSKIALSDAGVAATFAKAALKGASLNVFINTKSMKNRDVALDFERKADDMLDRYGRKADELFDDVMGRLR